MTGHEPLIAMRMEGRKPAGVWITDADYDFARRNAGDWPEHCCWHTGHQAAHIRLTADDIPEALDLRCVVGLTCHVHTERGERRFGRIFDALIAAGASVVAGVHNDQVRVHRKTQEMNHG